MSGRRLAVVVLAAALLAGAGWAATSVAGGDAPAPGPAAPITDPSTIARIVPLFALAKDHEHVLTANPAERRSLRAGGWHLDATATRNCDGIVGYVFDRPLTWRAPDGGTGSTVPLHRFRSKMTGVYRLGPAAAGRPGLADQGVVGHGFRDASRAAGTAAAVALHRRVDAETGETYLSTDARPRAGFADRGVVAWLRAAGQPGAPPAAAQLCPLTVLSRTVGGRAERRATTDLTTRAALEARGWAVDGRGLAKAADGVRGYLWDRPVPGTGPVEAGGRTLGWGFAAAEPGTARYRVPGGGPARLFTSADLPAPYYDVLRPAGPSRGVFVYVHGGGWAGDLAYAAQFGDPATPEGWHAPVGDAPGAPPGLAARMVASGFTVYRVEYHSGAARAASDVAWFVGQLRATIGPTTPLCMGGESAGGQLSLLTAAHRHDVACVVADAAPTDLRAARQAADAGGRAIYDAGLGPDRGGAWAAASPVSADLAGLRTRILLGTAASDGLVPPAQMVLLAGALGRAGAPAPVVVTAAAGVPAPRFGAACAPGSTPFGHACVTWAAYRDYVAAEALFVAAA